MPTIAPGIDPTMMRAPVAVATSVVPPTPAAMPGLASPPNLPADSDLRSTEVQTAVRPMVRGAPSAHNAQASMQGSLSVSMTAVPRRRIGVFLAALLIFDAGLATAGVLMMRSALGRAPSPATAPLPVVSPPTPGGTPPVAGDARLNSASAPALPAAGPKAAASTDSAASLAGAGTTHAGALGGVGANVQITPDQTPAAVHRSDKIDAKAADKKPTGTGPVDPYATAPPPSPTPSPSPTSGGPAGSDIPVPVPLPVPVPSGEQTAQEESLADQVRRREVASRARFARCYASAAKASDNPLIGAVTVSFQVTPQGRVDNVSAIDNSTESLSLARCVVAEVTKWTFEADAIVAQDFVRVFKFEGQ